jgi:hypothetical protein
VSGLIFVVVVVAGIAAGVAYRAYNSPRIKDGAIRYQGKDYALKGASARVKSDRRGYRNQKVQAFIIVDGAGYSFTARLAGKGGSVVSSAERLAEAINAANAS